MYVCILVARLGRSLPVPLTSDSLAFSGGVAENHTIPSRSPAWLALEHTKRKRRKTAISQTPRTSRCNPHSFSVHPAGTQWDPRPSSPRARAESYAASVEYSRAHPARRQNTRRGAPGEHALRDIGMGGVRMHPCRTCATLPSPAARYPGCARWWSSSA
ncbi:hypothetical protein B0H10DRAFT_767676 [Mycena sp. CBHHK59/15]|nr:hypothetical protein B0H10DRAFT_767676 [Mycena sp. CBHHK59/15]